MKNLLFTLVSTLVFGTFFGQTKSQFFVGYPMFEEFSLRRDVQNTTRPAFGNFERAENRIGLNIPNALSFEIGLMQPSNNRLNLHLYFYLSDASGTERPRDDGESMILSIQGIDFERSINLFKQFQNKWFLNAVLSSGFQIGNDLVFVSNLPPLVSRPQRKIRDFNLGLGLEYIYFPLPRLALKCYLGYSKWLYRYYNQTRYASYLLPTHSFNLRFSVGYGFGKKIGSESTAE